MIYEHMQSQIKLGQLKMKKVSVDWSTTWWNKEAKFKDSWGVFMFSIIYCDDWKRKITNNLLHFITVYKQKQTLK